MVRICSVGVVLEERVMGNVIGSSSRMVDETTREQPVVPLVFFAVRSKPPMNEPQVIPASFRRSPMLFLPRVYLILWSGRTDVANRIRIANHGHDELPPSIHYPNHSELGHAVVCPETRFSRPGVEGPKVVLYELSLMAKYCA